MKNITLSEEEFEWLKKLQKEYFTQDNRCTRTPIYLVQTRVPYGADANSSYDGTCLLDESSRDSDTIMEWVWSSEHRREQDRLTLEERLEMIEEHIFEANLLYKGLEDNEEKVKELKEKIKEYIEDYMPDLEDPENVKDMIEELVENSELRIWHFQYVWETRATCFTEQEAFMYKEMQKHNLGVSRTFAVSPGYANHGHFSKLHDLIRDLSLYEGHEERNLCKDAILKKIWGDDEERIEIEAVTTSNRLVKITKIRKYAVETEEKNHLEFISDKDEKFYLYDLEINSLRNIRRTFFNN